LQPLVDALKAHVLSCPVVHADETPVAMLAPGNGKTHRAYLWAYAADAFEPLRAVVFAICRMTHYVGTSAGAVTTSDELTLGLRTPRWASYLTLSTGTFFADVPVTFFAWMSAANCATVKEVAEVTFAS
jgi:hypothetical protein